MRYLKSDSDLLGFRRYMNELDFEIFENLSILLSNLL